jgi:RNAse (barnase) inhibitor barstar
MRRKDLLDKLNEELPDYDVHNGRQLSWLFGRIMNMFEEVHGELEEDFELLDEDDVDYIPLELILKDLKMK